MKKQFTISSIDELPVVAKEIISLLGQAHVVCLKGKMGAGKTTLVKALINELGVTDAGSSPTFALINAYESEQNGTIYHLDLYRLNHVSEALDIGIEDLIYGNKWCFIEWPDLVEGMLDDAVEIEIEVGEDGERVVQVKHKFNFPAGV
jgi:tRNA threonylcarbamoyladenosine biosynthesis protein TsaE